MKLQIFAVYDSKAEAFLQPYFTPNNNMALRAFSHAANNEDSDFCKFAADYTLFHIGDYETDTARISSLPTPKSLGVAIQFVHPEQTPEHPVRIIK